METLAVVLPFVPFVAGALIAAFGWRTATAWTAVASAVAVATIGAVTAVDVVDHGPISALDGQLRIDALSCLMLILIGTVAAITSTYGIAYLATELDRGTTTARSARMYGVLVQVTIAAMTVVVITDNLGVMWVAIETTTIATVVLVGHRRDRRSVEASWKYLVLGSVGVATALLGTVLVYFVSRQVTDEADALSWSALVPAAGQLDTGALQIAIGLIVVGYGTKAGLAPLHSWVPDAYSQAPAPAAGLMSGVVSAMSIYALFRFKVIADLALGDEFVRRLLIAAALASLVVAALMMVTQRDYKRLLAYSSVEHVGLVALATAVGSPLAMSAALLHLIGNGLAKSITFSVTGEIEFATGTTQIADIRGLLHQHRFIGSTFAIGLVALAGLPPFSILASEIALVRSGVEGDLTWAVAVALVPMMVIFTALAVRTLDMLTGPAAPTALVADGRVGGHRTRLTARVPLVAGLALAAAIGVTVWPFARLLEAAAEVVAR